jgi:hypothetical protein
MVRRTTVWLALGVAIAALAAPAAFADQPMKEPVPFPPATGQFCEGFMVSIEATENREVIHVFSSGVGLITGTLKVEVTNLSTDKTLELNISGPGSFSPDGTSITGTGRWLLFGEAGQLPGPDPGMMLLSGRLELTLGPAGIAGIESVGQSEDVCAALAAA